MRRNKLLLLIALLAPAFAVRASDKPLLIELSQRSGALPSGVSASGAVVVGGLGTGGGFYWMPTTGDIFIGGLSASNVSGDGHTIVGTVLDSRVTQAAVWVRAAEWRLLGSLRPGAEPCDTSLSSATDTSRDGRIVVGYGYDGCNITHALRWEAAGVVDLGSSVAGRPSIALGVSADGRVTVGSQTQADGFVRGAQWVDGRQELFPGPDGPVGAAQAASSDGSIVVGRVCSPASIRDDPNYQSAWVWTRQDGTRCLPAPRLRPSPGPPINVGANATSDDGRVMGGSQGIGQDDTEAIIWIDRVPYYLKDYLRANGVPDAFETWINTGSINDVSPDGRILVGKGAAAAGFRGYIVILGDRP